MTHLLCVMRAISNFQALLPSRSRLKRANLSPTDAVSPTISTPHIRPRHEPKPSMDEDELSEFKRQNEQHAMRLVKERMHILKSRAMGRLPLPTSSKEQEEPDDPVSPENQREHSEPPPQNAPPILGIGTGGVGDRPPHHTHSEPPSVVADSPGAVDFNVYDRAYEEEIQRIKQNGGRPSVYMTWHLGEKDRIRSREGEDLDLLEGQHNEEQAPDTDNSGKDKLKAMFKTHRLADLVSQTIKDTKEKVIGEERGS